MVVLSPDGTRSTYAKQMLHADEEPFFVPGTRDLDIRIAGHTVAPAICYEAMQRRHGESALARGASVYAASVAKHGRGIEQAHAHFGAFAAENSIPVVLVNAVGPCDTFVCAGGSAAWRADGTLIDRLSDEEGLLAVDL